jgi:hypothetical protein
MVGSGLQCSVRRFVNLFVSYPAEAQSALQNDFEDKLDAETVLNKGLKSECDRLRSAMGVGLDELRVKLESGLQLALGRVDHMETLLWQASVVQKYAQRRKQYSTHQTRRCRSAHREGNNTPRTLSTVKTAGASVAPL